MRIVDKNTDFYDYLQDVYRDDTLTFDRTDSFLLTKEMFCEYLRRFDNFNNRFYKRTTLHDYNFALLQICNTFWLFLIETTKVTKNGDPSEYTIELLKSWKNYSRNRELIKLDIISFNWSLYYYLSKEKHWRAKKDNIIQSVDKLVSSIDNNDYKVHNSINKCVFSKGSAFNKNERYEKHIPLLKACGIGSCVNPLDVFLAFEEYFSLEKTSSERRESIGLTDKEKIENHGFDTKISFRGKN